MEIFVNREQAKIWASIPREKLAMIQPTLSKHYDILRAYADGEEIESRDPVDSCGWKQERVDRIFFHDSLKYRVKQKVDKPSDRWIPKEGETYFYISSCLNVIMMKHENSDGISGDLVRVHNCFQTREVAEAAAERVRLALKGDNISK